MPSSAPVLPGPSAAARRGARLGAVVGVCAACVAAGLTGAGLLLPAAEPTPALRVVGALVALGAAGILVRLEGGARGVTSLAVVSAAALAVCVATLPVSPVAHPWTADPDPSSPLDGRPEGDAGPGRDVVIEPAAPADPPGGSGALVLPPGADVVVEGDDVVLTLPDGGRITIGGTAVGGAADRAAAGRVVVDGGVARIEGGDVLGPEVALGGSTFERGDGSRRALGGGALLDVPAPVEQEAPSTEGLDALLAVLLACFALVAFAPPVVRFGERVGVSLLDEPEPELAEPAAATASVEEGLAGVLRAMLTDPDPRTAVIGAYARLLAALAEAGHPRRDEEGPHEHLWRTLGPLGVRRQPVHQLAELFVRARFTPRPVTEHDRQAAIAALADAVGDLRLQAADVADVFAGIGVSR